jgi:DNA modification methylase
MYAEMKEVTYQDYVRFLNDHGTQIEISDMKVELRRDWGEMTFAPPEAYKPERQTVWSFPSRGNWATHVGDYRGNWSPYIPRNLILRYSKLGDLVLDQMVGSGTTLVECKLLGRNAIGVDVNPNAIMVARNRLDFQYDSPPESSSTSAIRTYVGDARNLNEIDSNSVDLIATHPPYAQIIRYTKRNKEAAVGDLSQLPFKSYVSEMHKVAEESIRVLKPDRHCAILIGDTRKQLHYVPIAFKVMQIFLDSGFIIREDIIKEQWKMKGTREKWRGRNQDFYLIAHEHIFVFRKPANDREYSLYKHSTRAAIE